MALQLPTGMASEVTASHTRLFWLVEFSLASTLRLCSRSDMTVGGDTFVHAGLTVRTAARRMQIINELAQYTAVFKNQTTAGARVRAWRGYGEGTVWQYSDLVLRLDGEMGALGISEIIDISFRDEADYVVPGLSIGDVIPDAHLIPDGAIARTPTGDYKLTTV